MYQCRVEKRILKSMTNRSEYTVLNYELKLAAAPERGQILKDGRWYSGPLTSVIWAIDEQCFRCRVEDEFPFVQGYEHYSHDWIVETLQLEGWSLCTRNMIRID